MIFELVYEDSALITANDMWERIQGKCIGIFGLNGDLAVNRFMNYRFDSNIPLEEDLIRFKKLYFPLVES